MLLKDTIKNLAAKDPTGSVYNSENHSNNAKQNYINKLNYVLIFYRC